MIHVVVGLGNPGRNYVKTRHNIGFSILDYLASEQGSTWKTEARWQSEVTSLKFEIPGQTQVFKLVKPLTFMNLSGTAVRSFMDWYQLSVEDLLVIADDVALPLGQLRFRAGGSSGGHNGLVSVAQHIQTQSFARLRCGIGPLPSQKNLADYVLENFLPLEEAVLTKMIEKAAEAIKCACILGLATAMNQFNQLEPQ